MVDKQLLGKYLEPFFKLSDYTITQLSKEFTLYKYPSKTIILEEGQECLKAGIIIKGLIRNFTQSNGKNCTLWFDSEGSLFGSMNAMYKDDVLAKESIEAIENTEILEMEIHVLKKMTSENEELKQLFDQILLFGYFALEQRVKEFVVFNAQERYDLFFKNYPKMVHRIPVKYLASFLGITPETMSRIRAKS